MDSPVPCLVLHRAWAGAVCGHPLYLSWCYTELGQGRCILVMIIEEVGGLELGVLGFGLIHIGFRVSGCLWTWPQHACFSFIFWIACPHLDTSCVAFSG